MVRIKHYIIISIKNKMFTRSSTRSIVRSFSTQTVNILNKQVRLAKRPIGVPTEETWQFTQQPIVPLAAEGDIIVRVNKLSLDPAMRGWLNDAKSYVPPVAIGEVMRAIGVGTVFASNTLLSMPQKLSVQP